jgi:hypothetical protein
MAMIQNSTSFPHTCQQGLYFELFIILHKMNINKNDIDLLFIYQKCDGSLMKYLAMKNSI